jgi:MoxR-like ATPase
MAYPEIDEELALAGRFLGGDAPEAIVTRGDVQQVVTRQILEQMKALLGTMTIKPELIEYALHIVRGTRSHPGVRVGAGPRGTQGLLLAARACAALDGRDFVTPDDIKAMSGPVLAHRLLLRPEYEMEGLSSTEVVSSILDTTAVPK